MPGDAPRPAELNVRREPNVRSGELACYWFNDAFVVPCDGLESNAVMIGRKALRELTFKQFPNGKPIQLFVDPSTVSTLEVRLIYEWAFRVSLSPGPWRRVRFPQEAPEA